MKKLLNPALMLALVLGVFAGVPAAAADRSESAEAGRIAVAPNRQSMAARRMPNVSANLSTAIAQTIVSGTTTGTTDGTSATTGTADATISGSGVACRDAYRACMDDFCLLDESEGNRCACSNRINSSKSIINEINTIQGEAEKLYTEGVEYEKLGAQAVLVFGSGQASKRKGIDWSSWMNSGSDESLDSDDFIGDNLYYMASEGCAARLAACGSDAEMEENLYTRQIANDCRNFGTFLEDQKKIATSNKAAAEKAVRAARASMLATTNKYNRGECLLAFKSCIADKGGCGENFENCLDASLLARRANACENVLDQCMAVKKDVLADWADESKVVLTEAAKYADTNRRATCRARTWACLEDSCGTGYSTGSSTSSQCLNNVNVAAGICPVINECNDIIPGFKSGITSELGYLRVRFCQNDFDKCLQEKCGANYTAPECVGKSTKEIVALCPQEMFPSCKDQDQFDVIVSAALLEMDYQSLQGCVNYFADALGRVCGMDMSCLPNDTRIESAKTLADAESLLAMSAETGKPIYAVNADAAVDVFFKQFEKDVTVKSCAKVGKNVFNQAKMLAYIGAENRAYRALSTKITELARNADIDAARNACNMMKTNDDSVISVNFEPDLRNCHICRKQTVCEEGGESKSAAGLKGAAGGLAAGASVGTMVTPGWGTAIGAVVGGVGGLFGGRSAGGIKEFCQDLTVCEDLNMDNR